jgi:hypothetical protein
MLAAMSSLTLAHTAAPAFNGLYYATVATIIPVLFLALAIQGNDYEELVKRGHVEGVESSIPCLTEDARTG